MSCSGTYCLCRHSCYWLSLQTTGSLLSVLHWLTVCCLFAFHQKSTVVSWYHHTVLFWSNAIGRYQNNDHNKTQPKQSTVTIATLSVSFFLFIKKILLHCTAAALLATNNHHASKTHDQSRQGGMEMPKNWRSTKRKALSSRSSKDHDIWGPYATTIAYKNCTAAKANQEKTRTSTILPPCLANCWNLHWTCITRHRELVHKITRT